MSEESPPSSWVILRMAGPRTLKVVASLKRAGFEVWTPTTMRRQMRPRSTKFRDVEVAALSTFAFASANQLPGLLAAQHDDLSLHPAFTVLQHQGVYQRARAAELQPLREYEANLEAEWQDFCVTQAAIALERRRKRKSRRKGAKSAARSYVLGQRVRVIDPAFTGLIGTVTESKGDHGMVIDFGGLLQVEIEACDLLPVHIEAVLP